MTTKEAMEHFDWSRAKLGKHLGIPSATLYTWGKYPPAGEQALIHLLSKGELKMEDWVFKQGKAQIRRKLNAE